MCLADLEFDYINPYDSSSRINKVVLPEFILQGLLCVFYLLTGHWVMSLLCAPYLYYNVRLYTQKKHLADVTEIFNTLPWEKKQRLFKLGYVVVLLFFSIFWMIWSTLDDMEDYNFRFQNQSLGSVRFSRSDFTIAGSSWSMRLKDCSFPGKIDINAEQFAGLSSFLSALLLKDSCSITFCSDIPMAQFIVNMNAALPASQKFIIHVLDNTHFFVQPDVAGMIRSAISEFRDQNSYEKPT
ncbi:hypothetical protein V6N13_077005 [Hibiscus sabdariffa]